MSSLDIEAITVVVPFSKEEVQVPRDVWQGCQRLENRLAILAAGALVGVFGAGVVVEGLMQAGALGFVVLGWLYFDGVVARRCAVAKARRG